MSTNNIYISKGDIVREIYNLKALMRMVMNRSYINIDKKLRILEGYGIIHIGTVDGIYKFQCINPDPRWSGKIVTAKPVA